MIICSKIFHGIEGDGDRHLVNMVLNDNGETLGQLGDPAVEKQAEVDLHEQIETRFAEKGGAYADSFRAVMHDPNNAALKQAYAGFTQDRYAQHVEPEMSSQEAGLEVDKRARMHMAEHGDATYQEAMHAVLDADPAVKTAYHQSQPMD